MASQSETSVAPAPKRSLFKKAAPGQPTEEDEGLKLFSRSREVFPDILAENERRRKNPEKNKPNGDVDRAQKSTSDSKKRRISQDSDDEERHSSDDEIVARLLQERKTSNTRTPDPSGVHSTSTSPRQKRPANSKSKSRQDTVKRQSLRKSKTPERAVVTLSDSEDETVEETGKNSRPPQVNLDSDSDLEEDIAKLPKVRKVVVPPEKDVFEDEEFAEYVAKARAGAARQVFGRLDPAQSNARSDSIHSDDSSTKPERTKNIPSVSISRPAPDPVVQILVSSRIDGTRPLLVKRKLSQRLKDVRLAWCDKQVFDGQPVSEETKRLIFLTWRGNKVFDVTTCKALGLTADASGRLRIDGEGFDEEGRIHLEAWTQETFDEVKKQKAAERRRLILNPMDAAEEKEEMSNATPIEAKEQIHKIRIILKSKGHPEFKVQVVPSTPILKMINTFKKHHKIPETTNASLYLDGDKLDPAGVVGDADLDDDMTTIDVHMG